MNEFPSLLVLTFPPSSWIWIWKVVASLLKDITATESPGGGMTTLQGCRLGLERLISGWSWGVFVSIPSLQCRGLVSVSTLQRLSLVSVSRLYRSNHTIEWLINWPLISVAGMLAVLQAATVAVGPDIWRSTLATPWRHDTAVGTANWWLGQRYPHGQVPQSTDSLREMSAAAKIVAVWS